MSNASGLRYETTGPADAPTILLLHGFMGSSAEWTAISGSLSDEYRCLIPDLPGHGVSTGLPYPDAYTMDGAARALLALLDAENVDRCTIVGYSMGGRLALYLALRHQERAGRLLLESASPGLATEEERAARRAADEELAQRLETGDLREFIEGWYRAPLFATLARDEDLLRRTIEARLQNDPRELACSLRAMGTGSQPQLWGELPKLEPPTLAMTGEEDEKFARIGREIERTSFKVRSVVVSGSGHSVHSEAPESYIRLVRNFLEEELWPLVL